MRAFAFVVLSYLLMGVESSLLHHLQITRLAPEIGALSVIFVAATLGLKSGVLVSMCIGFLADGFAMGTAVGLLAEVYVLLFLCTRAIFRKIALRGAITSLVIGFFGPMLSGVLAMGIGWVFDQVFDGYGVAARAIVPNALVSAPFAPLVFFLYSRLDRALTRRRSDYVFFR